MEFPRGAIPLVQKQYSHHQFATAVQPRYALIKITDARRLVKCGETAESYFKKNTKVITSTTVDDLRLKVISWEDETEIVREFQPDYHIPCDYSTYEKADKKEREQNLDKYLQGTLTIRRWLHEAGDEIEIIPLIKGVTDNERAKCLFLLERYDFAGYVFYGTQYFTGGEGNRINELVEDVTSATQGHNRPLMLIGLLSPNYLKRMPAQLCAAVGQNRWRGLIKPQKQEGHEMRQQWANLRSDVCDALNITPDEQTTEDKGLSDTSTDTQSPASTNGPYSPADETVTTSESSSEEAGD